MKYTLQYSDYAGYDPSYANPIQCAIKPPVIDHWKKNCPTNIQRIKNNPESINWFDWHRLSSDENICTIEEILQNPDLNWHFDALQHRSDFSKDLIVKYPSVKWNFDGIHGVWDIVEKRPDLKWDWKELVQCNTFPWNRLSHLLKDEIYSHIVSFTNFDWKLFEQLIDKPWNFEMATLHVPANIIARYPDKSWSWTYLSKIDKLNWRLVMAFYNKPWDKKMLSMRKDIPLYVLKTRFNILHAKAIVKNPKYNKAFVQKYWTIPWRGIFNTYRRERAAEIIQRRWREAVANPYTIVGQIRLFHEYCEMQDELANM